MIINNNNNGGREKKMIKTRRDRIRAVFVVRTAETMTVHCTLRFVCVVYYYCCAVYLYYSTCVLYYYQVK